MRRWRSRCKESAPRKIQDVVVRITILADQWIWKVQIKHHEIHLKPCQNLKIQKTKKRVEPWAGKEWCNNTRSANMTNRWGVPNQQIKDRTWSDLEMSSYKIMKKGSICPRLAITKTTDRNLFESNNHTELKSLSEIMKPESVLSTRKPTACSCQPRCNAAVSAPDST